MATVYKKKSLRSARHWPKNRINSAYARAREGGHMYMGAQGERAERISVVVKGQGSIRIRLVVVFSFFGFLCL